MPIMPTMGVSSGTHGDPGSIEHLLIEESLLEQLQARVRANPAFHPP